ncbi:unnamed protein product [Thlaspi arvense]|uniref:CN hydrolase domain-containing protein n=1 Tax=Thlaspi arvense TaxID=13288 RepID=A0AAU9SPV9_THLAR|nr:unnamed protein product [Thlaspi arvense]
MGEKSGDSVKISEALDGPVMQRYCSLARFGVDVPGGSSYKESGFTVPRTNIVSVDSPIGRLGLTVCYDLRFPKIYQQLRFDQNAQVEHLKFVSITFRTNIVSVDSPIGRLGLTVLLVPSAFTTVTGEAHWEILLRARALKHNVMYVIADVQAGKHNEKRENRFSTGIVVADIDFSLLDSVRTKMPIDKQRVSIDL